MADVGHSLDFGKDLETKRVIDNGIQIAPVKEAPPISEKDISKEVNDVFPIRIEPLKERLEKEKSFVLPEAEKFEDEKSGLTDKKIDEFKKSDKVFEPLPSKVNFFSLFFVLILLVISFFVLSKTFNLEVVDFFAEKYLKELTYNSVVSSVLLNYPLLSDYEKAVKIGQDFGSVIKSKEFNFKLFNLAKVYKNFYSDSDGVPFFLGAESYFILSGSENFVIDKFVGFIKSFAGFKGLFFSSLILAFISIMLFYFIVKKVSGCNVVSFATSLLFCLHPVFFENFSAGHLRIVLFGEVFILFVVFLIIHFIDFSKKSVLIAPIIVLSLILFKSFSEEVDFLFFLIAIFIISAFIFKIVFKCKNKYLKVLIYASFSFFIFKIFSSERIASSAQFNPAVFNDLMNNSGFIFLAINFVVFIMILFKNAKSFDLKQVFALSWLFTGAYFFSLNNNFLIYFISSFFIFSSFAIKKFKKLIELFLEEFAGFNKNISLKGSSFIIIILVFAVIFYDFRSPIQEFPVMNDAFVLTNNALYNSSVNVFLTDKKSANVWKFLGNKLVKTINFNESFNGLKNLSPSIMIIDEDGVSNLEISLGGKEIIPISYCKTLNETFISCSKENFTNLKNLSQNRINGYSVILIEDGMFSEVLMNEKSGVSQIIFKEKDGVYKNLLINKNLRNLIAVRLFAGEKINGFEKLYEIKDLPKRIVAVAI